MKIDIVIAALCVELIMLLKDYWFRLRIVVGAIFGHRVNATSIRN